MSESLTKRTSVRKGVLKTPLSTVMDTLGVLAKNGGNEIKTARLTGQPRSNVRRWRRIMADEYQQLAENLAAVLEGRIVTEYREGTLEATEAMRLAIRRTYEQLERDEDKVPAASAQRMATVAGIATDKSLTLEGRPTSIAATSTVQEDIRWLKARAIPDADVVEDAEVIPGSQGEPTEGNHKGEDLEGPQRS